MRGMIVIWSGAIVDIPTGWILCDGNNGTPDLRNKFIVGAGDTYAVDAVGGSLTHDHTWTGDGHSHTIPAGPALAPGAPFDNTTTINPATGSTNFANHLPTYHSLAYIMKT